MSEPIKKPGQAKPESYTPTKPAIVSMTENIRKMNNREAIAMNSEKVLKGIHKVYYGMFGGITPYPICLKAVADYLGDGPDYTYAIVACGGAFRFAWDNTVWNPGNVDICLAYSDGETPYRNGITALGRDFKMLWRANNNWNHPGTGEKEDFKTFIREQIDMGKPVISLGPIGPAEAGIITGYRNGGDTLLGWSLFQDWECRTFDENGHYISDTWWDVGDFLGVMSIGDIIAPRPDTKQIILNAITALEGRQEGNYAKGIAAYESWKKALLGASETDFARTCGNDSLVMMCQGDATDCLIDGRKNAHLYFMQLAEENPGRPLYAEIAAQFGIVAKTVHEKIYGILGGWERGPEQIKALENSDTRHQIGEHIDVMKAADEKALELMKELYAKM